MEKLTSRQNPLVQDILRLKKNRGYRYERRLFIADGVKLVEEAIKWKADILAILHTESVSIPLPDSASEYLISEDLMAYLSSMGAPQGIIAVIRMPESISRTITPGCLILDHLQDPGNVGTILRTADALSIPVWFTEGCVDPYNEKTVRSSMGAVFRSPPTILDTDCLISACNAGNIPVAVADLRPDSLDLRAAPVSSYAIVIGNEGHGVSDRFRQAAACSLIIPIYSGCESLNAAIAATIFMWQMKNDRQ